MLLYHVNPHSTKPGAVFEDVAFVAGSVVVVVVVVVFFF